VGGRGKKAAPYTGPFTRVLLLLLKELRREGFRRKKWSFGGKLLRRNPGNGSLKKKKNVKEGDKGPSVTSSIEGKTEI